MKIFTPEGVARLVYDSSDYDIAINYSPINDVGAAESKR